MATANELLAMAADSGVDKTLIIDNDLRTIIIPKSVTNLGTEFEKDVHRLQFQMPRYFNDIDLSELNIRINYMNTNNEGDIYAVTDKKILSSTITFSWLVGAHALMYKGPVNFIVCLKKSDTAGKVLKEFNTTPASLPVLEGLEVDTAALETPMMDILEQLMAITDVKLSEVESAGAEQIAKVSAKSTEEQENIANKGVEVLATIPEDYQTTYKLANEGVRTKADAIVCSSVGEVITVTDSSDDNLRGLNIFGKSTQVKTTGAQKLPFPYYENSLTCHGVTFTVNKDGSIKMSGTNTANDGASCYFMLNNAFNATGQYTYKCYGLPSNCVTNIYYRGDVIGESEMLLDLYAGNDYGIVIRIGVGVTVNATVYPMLNEGSSALPWEPYTGGIPAPNPEYPQEIVSIENPTVEVYGKNLIHITQVSGPTGVGCDVTVHDDGSVTINGTATKEGSIVICNKLILPVGEYRICGERVTAFLRTAETKHISTHFSGSIVRIDDPTYHLFICVYANKNQVFDNFRTYPMVCAVSVENIDYEQYVEVQSITANHTLPAIPVTSGGNYTDSDGQQWICDEIDFEHGVYVQRIKKFILSDLNPDTWYTWGVDKNGNGITGFYHYFTDNVLLDFVLCNIGIYGSTTWGGLQAGVGISANSKYITLSLDNSCLADTSSDDMAIDSLKVLLAETNATMLAAIEPIETPLTADEIAAFKVLRSNYPNTTVLNDSGVTMKLKYNADTETWIKNLIDERIAAAIASIQ